MSSADEIVVVRSHPRCLGHVPVIGHPDTPSRLRAVVEALKAPPVGPWLIDDQASLPADEDTEAVLRWIHEPAYIGRVRDASSVGGGHVDSEDCTVSSGTYAAALAAAGLAVQSALDMANGRVQRVFLGVRPPGHHAARDRAKGFCFFNNVALAVEVLVRAWNAPVLVVDFDVHHGDGTQGMFYGRGVVGYVGVHRDPFFPGTGTAEETGEGAGAGTTRNVPLAAGADDGVYAAAVENALEGVGARLRPAAVLVSAGFDAHRLDPVGGMNVTDNGFRRIAAAIVQAARAWSGGRVLSVLEGGHNPSALCSAVRAYVEVLAGQGDDSSGAEMPS